MTDASPRRLGIAVIVIALHVTLLALLLRSVVHVAPPPTAAIELANIAAPPPAPPPLPATAATTPAKVAAPLPAPAAAPPFAAPVVDAAPSAPVGDGTTGTAALSGGAGNGSGILRARWASGSISNRDYPKAARKAGIGGAVTVHFDVRAEGGVEHCRVVASSGSAILDETTCQLIEARFRYVPARDATGTAITDIAGWRQDWWLGAPN